MKFASIFALGLAPLASASTEYGFIGGTVASPIAGSGIAGMDLTSTIAVPGSKTLLIGLSAEVNLLTKTVAKGKNKEGTDTSTAEAGLTAGVKLVKESEFTSAASTCASSNAVESIPSQVTFSSRTQELTVDVALEIESELDLCEDCEITGYVEVGLSLETTAAHHFNFIIDVPETCSSSNPCRVVACFGSSASSSAENGSADSYVKVGNALLTVQEVLSFTTNKGRNLRN
jgi:hypothetical protein